jgi:hypothetical protein
LYHSFYFKCNAPHKIGISLLRLTEIKLKIAILKLYLKHKCLNKEKGLYVENVLEKVRLTKALRGQFIVSRLNSMSF